MSDTSNVSQRRAHPPTDAEVRSLYEAMHTHGLTKTPVDVLVVSHQTDAIVFPTAIWDARNPHRVSSATVTAYAAVAEAGAQYRPTMLTVEQVGRACGKSTKSAYRALTMLIERGWLLAADCGTRGKLYRAMLWPIENADDPRVAEHAAAADAIRGDRTGRDRTDALRAAISKRREAILDGLVAVHGPKCFYCGHEPADVYELHVEHRQPASRGGTNDHENLVPACEGCNGIKGDMTEAEFYAFLETALFEGGL